MANYSEKECDLCSKKYYPTSPKQRYCEICREQGRKLKQSELDKKKNRLNHPNELTKICKSCNIEFKTYYPQKEYCGAEECNKIRLYVKNKRIQARRSKEYMIEKGRRYYKENKELCLSKKAVDYRKQHPTAKDYVPGRINNHTYDYVKQYIDNNNYKLLSEEYLNNKSKLLLECPKGHKWLTTFHGFKDLGARCLHCYSESDFISRPEQSIRDYFTSIYPNINILYNDRSTISPYELDLYFPDHNLAIEVCGLYWHGERSGKPKNYHYNKMMMCYDKGIRLITVFEDELNDRFDIVISRICQALGLYKHRIFARKCKVIELTSKEANSFYNSNHLQGKSTALAAWGLVYDNEIVGVCSLGNLVRRHTDDGTTIELKRFCTIPGMFIVGGAGKLFSAAKTFAINKGFSYIKSYCDMRYANIFNPVYEVLGFSLKNSTKYTPHYTMRGKRYRNVSLRKTPEERLTGKTEKELRFEQGYDVIWDCGHRTYIYKL